MKEKQEKLSDALLKVALGFQVAEVTEEYAEVDGELKLTKRRRTKKDVPPDLKAVQLLLTEENIDYLSMSDEELLAEKNRLIKELNNSERIGQVSVESKKTPKNKTKTTSRKKGSKK